MLKIIRQLIGMTRSRNANVNVIPSIMQKMKNSRSVKEKLIREEILRDKRKRHFGILILVKMSALARSEPIPPLVASEK